MFASARKAIEVVFDRAFLGVLLKAVALTVALFAALFVAAQLGIHHLLGSHSQALGPLLNWLAAFVLLLLVPFLGAPVAALFAGLFLDEIAEAVERRCYPSGPPARRIPFWQGLLTGLRLFGWTVLLGLLMLPANILLPGIGTILTFLVNGWLLGREYFELAALRHLSLNKADALRRRHSAPIAGGGALVAVLAAIPFANVIAPLFGAALMVHEFKRYAVEDRIYEVA